MAADQERAERISALKDKRPDLTWRRIADHVGVSERAASNWKVTGGIDYANAEKLAEILEVDVDYIWRGPLDTERAPSPFAGTDALADQLHRIEVSLREARKERHQHAERIDAAMEAHATRISDMLDTQNRLLAKLESAITRGESVTREAESTTRDLLVAVAAATQYLRGGAQSPAASSGTPAK